MAFQAQAFAPVGQAHSQTSKTILLKRLQTIRLTECSSKNLRERSTIRATRTLCSSRSRDQGKPILLQQPLLALSISIMRLAVITAMAKMKRRRRSPLLSKETMVKKMTAKKAQSQTMTLLRKLFSTIRMLEAITTLSSSTTAYKEATPIPISTICEREMVVMPTKAQTTVELTRCLHRDTTRAIITTSCLHNSSKRLRLITILLPRPILTIGLK